MTVRGVTRAKVGVAPREFGPREFVPTREDYARAVRARGPLCPGCGIPAPPVEFNVCRQCNAERSAAERLAWEDRPSVTP